MFCLLISGNAAARDFHVTGRVTDASGNIVPGTRISMTAGTSEYAAITGPDGYYSLRISGLYGEIPGLLETGMPYPNPFSWSVNVPFIINTPGDIRFSVYSLSGQKIKDISFRSVEPGSYRIIWDGRSDNGAPVRQGFYIYAITFQGRTWSGRLIKAAGISTYSSSTSLEPVMMPSVISTQSGPLKIPVITNVTKNGFYPVRLTDIVLSRDTIIDFTLAGLQQIPFKTSTSHIEMHTESGYRPLILKGINLGSSPPGTFPGEIAYAISGDIYENWIERMAEAGFNSIRVYTLHPPVFYEKLANYNERHPDEPLLLFQGIWLGEIEDGSNPADYDLILRTEAFRKEIREVIDCVHGKKNIAFRPGRAYGIYSSDLSRWTAGYIIGREIMPQEVDATDENYPELTSFSGNQLTISGASATEVFITRMLDETVTWEHVNYSVNRPVSISSWPTLDPLSHPTEIHPDEDKASFDITKINTNKLNAGIFACYHAYPYYPNFISSQPSYRAYSDDEGPNSYLGYLTDMKNHYSEIPLVIGEFGVPSSWGSAHQSFSGMNHGGYSEIQQGEKNIRLMHNIMDAGCAGGFMFSWMDEWFKTTWLVSYLEAFGFSSEGITIATRQLWHNLISAEQNFGLLTFKQKETLPFISYGKDNVSGPIEKIEATSDNSFFYLNIESDFTISDGDTIMIAFDTYSSSTGESQLPDGKVLSNRSEFLLSVIPGNDTAIYYVTQAYDMNGLTPRFNLTDPLVQKYKSTVTDGAPWVPVKFYNDGSDMTIDQTGRLPIENSPVFSPGNRSAAAWSGNMVRVRIPWTMLHFFDPTRMEVINGAVTYDGGRSFEIIKALSDGIAVSVYCKGSVTSSTTRFKWQPWLVVPPTIPVEKKSLQVVEEGLSSFPWFAD